MTSAEFMTALERECPNGVSFDPMAVRLLRQKVPFEDWQIEDLQAAMFQLENGLWFSDEMISDEETQLEFEKQAKEWLNEYGCFSVERLFKGFYGVFHHIATTGDCAIFLKHLGFKVEVWSKGGYLCSLTPSNIDHNLEAISETIAEWLEKSDGTLLFNEIEQAMPHLTADALRVIQLLFLPEVHEAEVGGVRCWRSTGSIMLPEDFSDKLTVIIDTMVALDENVTVSKLGFALNLFYQIHLREEYALLNDDTFIRICAQHYQGYNNVFSNNKITHVNAKTLSVLGRRVRSSNTRFRNLGVPVGAELVFIKDRHISCIVQDDLNQVEYDGNAWAISALANHLLGVSSGNGFRHFSYEGEILWDRRLRLKQEDNKYEYQETKIQEAEGGIIGLDGRTITAATWRAFRRDGTNPHVAEWVRLIEQGERLEQIASVPRYAISTMKNMISNYRLYFKVCLRNGIAPEVCSNV